MPQPQELKDDKYTNGHLAPFFFPHDYCHGSSFRSLLFLLFAAQFFSIPSRRGSHREGFLAEYPDHPGGA